MADVAYTAGLCLAGVFLVAGVAKLTAPAATAESFTQLGLPAPRALARLVPSLELALALGLIFFPAVASLLALGVLAGFATFLVRVVRSGAQVACACFGTAGRQRVSWVEVARNAMLFGLAAIAGFSEEAAVPGLDAAVFVTTAAATGAVALALAALPRGAGRRIIAGQS